MTSLRDFLRNFITESVQFTGVKTENKTFKEVMSGLSKQGLKYAGTMHWTNKNINGYYPDELDNIFEAYRKLEKKVLGSSRFSSGSLNVNTSSKFNLSDWPGICNPRSKEEVIQFSDKDKQGYKTTYFCFYSTYGKYYYMINLKKNSSWIGGWNEAQEALKVWIDVKTKSAAEIEPVLRKEKTRQEEEEVKRQIRQEEYRKKQEEEKRSAARITELKNEIKEIQKEIWEDYKKNEDKYSETTWNKLPQKARSDIEKAVKAKTESEHEAVISSCKFFEYSRYIGSDPGGQTYLCIINTRDLKKPYKYYHYQRSQWSLD